jgi:hypothetical protein
MMVRILRSDDAAEYQALRLRGLAGVQRESMAKLRHKTWLWGTERSSLVVAGEPQDEHHMVCRAPGAA